MIIASLKKQNNNVLITFDDETILKIDYRTFVDFRLFKGMEIEKDLIELLSYESSFVKAKDSAYRILARRLHSSKELKQKLLLKKIQQDIVNKVIEEFKEKQFLNDDEFAKSFVQEKLKKGKTGINKLSLELSKKGINKELKENILHNIDSSTFYENALALAKKKLEFIKQKESDNKKIFSKIANYLTSKGFEYDIIWKVIKNLQIDIEE